MKDRICSAAVLIAIVLICMLISPVTRLLFFAAAACLCIYELCTNLKKLSVKCASWVLYLYIASQCALFLLSCFTDFHPGMLLLAACFTGAVYLAMFAGIINSETAGSGAVYTVFALCFPCVLFVCLMGICISGIWVQTLVIACISSWVCDSFALFGGKRFGKHKLAPLVSPNKTVEGAVCGAISSLFAGLAVYYLMKLYAPVPLLPCLLTALISSSIGQIGDLAESLIKRMIDIKDFSNLIPGHGGMFDRADSLLFSIPTAYICLLIAGIA